MGKTSQDDAFSAAERAAMKERAAELRAGTGSDGERDVLAAIEALPEGERATASAFHALVRDVAPDLVPRTWYGMPAYAEPGRKGKVVCFFTSASKGESRYGVVGFTDSAALDQGSMWPTSYALLRWNATNEKKLRALVRRATT